MALFPWRLPPFQFLLLVVPFTVLYPFVLFVEFDICFDFQFGFCYSLLCICLINEFLLQPCLLYPSESVLSVFISFHSLLVTVIIGLFFLSCLYSVACCLLLLAFDSLDEQEQNYVSLYRHTRYNIVTLVPKRNGCERVEKIFLSNVDTKAIIRNIQPCKPCKYFNKKRLHRRHWCMGMRYFAVNITIAVIACATAIALQPANKKLAFRWMLAPNCCRVIILAERERERERKKARRSLYLSTCITIQFKKDEHFRHTHKQTKNNVLDYGIIGKYAHIHPYPKRMFFISWWTNTERERDAEKLEINTHTKKLKRKRDVKSMKRSIRNVTRKCNEQMPDTPLDYSTLWIPASKYRPYTKKRNNLMQFQSLNWFENQALN